MYILNQCVPTQHRCVRIQSRWLYVKDSAEDENWGGDDCSRILPLFGPVLQAIYYIEESQQIRIVFDGELCKRINLIANGTYNLRSLNPCRYQKHRQAAKPVPRIRCVSKMEAAEWMYHLSSAAGPTIGLILINWIQIIDG